MPAAQVVTELVYARVDAWVVGALACVAVGMLLLGAAMVVHACLPRRRP